MEKMNELTQLADKLEQYFAYKSGCKKIFLSKRGEDFYVQTTVTAVNCEMPLDVSISEDGEWAVLALNLCMNCLPGCEQRLLTYCARLCMNTEQYVQGTFRVHPNRALYFYAAVPADCVLEDADYFLDGVVYRSVEMLERFHPTLQKLCSGRMLEYVDFRLASAHYDYDFDKMTMSKSDDEKLCRILEEFMEEVAENCISDECFESISSLYLRNELFAACGQKNVVLDVWPEDVCRVCIRLELPLQKIPNTEPMLMDCFQKIYASTSWNQGTFCIEKNGKVSLRMGLDAHAVLRCPQLLRKLTEDGVRLIQIYYPMLNSIAQGKLLEDESCMACFYELQDAAGRMGDMLDFGGDEDQPTEENSWMFESDEENLQETDEEDDRYTLAWDDPFELGRDDEEDNEEDEWGEESDECEEDEEAEDFELDEEMWDKFCKELEEDNEAEAEQDEQDECDASCDGLNLRSMEEIFRESVCTNR